MQQVSMPLATVKNIWFSKREKIVVIKRGMSCSDCLIIFVQPLLYMKEQLLLKREKLLENGEILQETGRSLYETLIFAREEIDLNDICHFVSCLREKPAEKVFVPSLPGAHRQFCC